MDEVIMEAKEEDSRLCLKVTTLWKMILAHYSCMMFSYAVRKPLIDVLQSKQQHNMQIQVTKNTDYYCVYIIYTNLYGNVFSDSDASMLLDAIFLLFPSEVVGWLPLTCPSETSTFTILALKKKKINTVNAFSPFSQNLISGDHRGQIYSLRVIQFFVVSFSENIPS